MCMCMYNYNVNLCKNVNNYNVILCKNENTYFPCLKEKYMNILQFNLSVRPSLEI